MVAKRKSPPRQAAGVSPPLASSSRNKIKGKEEKLENFTTNGSKKTLPIKLKN
jgi:hypothetical protein